MLLAIVLHVIFRCLVFIAPMILQQVPPTLSTVAAQTSDTNKSVSASIGGDSLAVVEQAPDAKLPAISEKETGRIEVPALASEMQTRRTRLENCLAHYYIKHVNADKLRPWSIMHWVIAFGQQAMVVSQEHKVNAVDYLCENGRGHDRRILSVVNGKLSAATGQGFQGHEGQLLAILAQANVPIDHPIVVDGQNFTIQDLVEYEQQTCRVKSELTFKLIGLSCYLASDEVWKNDQGQAWDISRLIHEEISQPINGAACGGIHRLMALSFALEIRRARDEPIDGQWQRIAHFLSKYHNFVFSLQNPDGSFSTDWFEGMSNSADPARKLYTTGHTLEWLSFSLSDERLDSSETSRAVDFMLSLLESNKIQTGELDGLDVGPKGHALRALRLYELRVFGEPSKHQQLAKLDEHTIATPQQVAELQPKIPDVLPSDQQTLNRQTNAKQVSSPAVQSNRGGRFFKRR